MLVTRLAVGVVGLQRRLISLGGLGRRCGIGRVGEGEVGAGLIGGRAVRIEPLEPLPPLVDVRGSLAAFLRDRKAEAGDQAKRQHGGAQAASAHGLTSQPTASVRASIRSYTVRSAPSRSR